MPRRSALAPVMGIGTSRETVAKALQRLRRDDLVETSRRHVLLPDLHGLRQAAGVGSDLGLSIPA